MTSTERDPAWSERLNPRNWSLAAKLVAVGLVPTLLALVLGVLRISDQAGVAAQLGQDNRLLDIRAGVTETTQALQAERNAAVLFVAGGRQGDRGPLDQAVAASDASLDRVRTELADPALLDTSGTTALQNAEGGFTQLPVLRSEAGGSVVGTDDVRSRYTAIIERAGVLERALVRQAATADGAGLGDALTATSEAREALALQHTTLAGAIVAGELREPDRIAVTGTDAAFTSAFADYQVALTPEQLSADGNFATDAANVERERLRSEIMATPAGRPITADPAAWDTAYADSVAVVDRASAGVGGELSATSVSAQENASNQAGVNSVILMLGVLLGIAIIVLLARSLIRSLRILRRSALEVAEQKLPAAVDSMRSGQPLNAMVQPVPLSGRDEVGQVARAFDAVHGQAIRLAADQAALQSNVSNMFVNLSRRSQALVERQLQLIEQLESNEQDPDQLSNLFQLDHLATRMRRNSENLLVLAGTDLTKRNVAPVPVVDVLRAAVSEIEQYQRVVVQPPPVATVAGRAASDLVHLLAELLDNATNFSPPDSQVVMSTTRANDGSLFVEIADRGVGMADHELSEANQRLGQPAAVDVSASRRMGLFVVGRLANRHGLDVRLGGGMSGGAGGGLTASVTVPPNLVPTAEPVDRRAARAGAPAGAVPASAFGGAPALPAPTPAASPSLPEQRPSNGRSLSSLVAGDDGPMSPAPAFGGGRPPAPPVNGNGQATRRPGPVPPEDDDTAGDTARPAGPERGPWPVESLRKPPNGDIVPTTNGSAPAAPSAPSAFTGPAELPKRTPRGLNGTPRGEGRDSGGVFGGSDGAPSQGRTGGLAAGAAGAAAAAAGIAGASALRRGSEEQPPAESDPQDEGLRGLSVTGTLGVNGPGVRPAGVDRPSTPDAPPDPETAAAAEIAADDVPAEGLQFPSGLPRRTPGPNGSGPSAPPRRGAHPGGAFPERGATPTGSAPEGASALDRGPAPGGLPTRRPGASTSGSGSAGSGTGTAGSGTAGPGGLPTRRPASPADRSGAEQAPGDSVAFGAGARPAPEPPAEKTRTETSGPASTDAGTTDTETSGLGATGSGTADTDSTTTGPAGTDSTGIGTGRPGTAEAHAGTERNGSFQAQARTDRNGSAEGRVGAPGTTAGPDGVASSGPDTDAGSPRTGERPDGSAATEATDTRSGESNADGAGGTDGTATAGAGAAASGAPATDTTDTTDKSAGAFGAALGSAALGAAALGGAATARPGREEERSETTAETRDEEREESTGAERLGAGLPQRRPQPPGRPADRRPATGSLDGSSPTRSAEDLPAAPAGGPSPRETPPIGPAGLPQRTPRRPRQAPTGGTDGLFAASTPGDTQTTGQLRRPGGFESRRPRRPGSADAAGSTAAEAFGQGAPDSGAAPAATPRAGLGAPVGSDGAQSGAVPARTEGTDRTGDTGRNGATPDRAAGVERGDGVDRTDGSDRAETRSATSPNGLPVREPGRAGAERPTAAENGVPLDRPETTRPDTSPAPDRSTDGRPANGAAENGRLGNGALPFRAPGANRGPQGPRGNGNGHPGQAGQDGPQRPAAFGGPAAPAAFGGGPFTARPPASRPGPGPRPGSPGVEQGRPGPSGPPQRPAPGPRPPATDDAGLPGSHGAGPAPSRPSGFDLGQTTPIFEEIASAWFRSNGDVPVRWAETGAPAEEPALPPVFATAADEGWRVADATAQATAAESDKQAETTDAGLPKRRPRARLVPGNAAGSAVLAPPSGPARNAEAIRGRLASYQQGVRQGRESRLRRQAGQPSQVPGANEQQNEENR